MTRRAQRGVTMIELMIVTTIIGVVIAVTTPMIGSGLDALRLEQACDNMAAFLNGAVNRAERRQVPVEVVIVPKENAARMRSVEKAFARSFSPPRGVRIVGDEEMRERRYLIMPGGTIPRFEVEFITENKKRRIVAMDPLAGIPIVRHPK